MFKFTRRAVMAAMISAGALSAGVAQADDWPSRPITLIYPYGPGDADILGRAVADTIERAFGQPVNMVHMPGAGGVVGGTSASQADPDGYTVYYGTSSNLAAVTELYNNPPYDPITAFDPVINLGDFPLWLFARRDLGFESLQDLIDAAQADPGGLNIAVAHTTGKILTALFEIGAGVDLNWINYASDPDVVPDMLAGRVDAIFGTGQWIQYQNDGMVNALVAATTSRSAELPDVPTLVEAGLEPLPIQVFVGVAVPAGTDPEIIARLNDALNDGMQNNPLFQQAFAYLRVVVAEPNEPEDFARVMQSTLEGYRVAVPLAEIPRQ